MLLFVKNVIVTAHSPIINKREFQAAQCSLNSIFLAAHLQLTSSCVLGYECLSMYTHLQIHVPLSVFRAVQIQMTRSYTASEKMTKEKKKDKTKKQGTRWQPCGYIYLTNNVSNFFSVTSAFCIVCVHSVIDGICVLFQFLTMTLFDAMITAKSRSHRTAF